MLAVVLFVRRRNAQASGHASKPQHTSGSSVAPADAEYGQLQARPARTPSTSSEYHHLAPRGAGKAGAMNLNRSIYVPPSASSTDEDVLTAAEPESAHSNQLYSVLNVKRSTTNGSAHSEYSVLERPQPTNYETAFSTSTTSTPGALYAEPGLPIDASLQDQAATEIFMQSVDEFEAGGTPDEHFGYVNVAPEEV